MRQYEKPKVTSENRCPPRSFCIPGGRSEYRLLDGKEIQFDFSICPKS